MYVSRVLIMSVYECKVAWDYGVYWGVSIKALDILDVQGQISFTVVAIGNEMLAHKYYINGVSLN